MKSGIKVVGMPFPSILKFLIPFAEARLAARYIKGVQERGVAARAKHFALNNQEINWGSVNVMVDE